MKPLPPKSALKEELATLLTGELATRERAHRAAREGATHEEAKPENDKDTRALEQSYLARGEALRVEQLRGALAEVHAMPSRAFAEQDAVALGALVTTEEAGGIGLVLLAPHGGGHRLARGAVQVVTPKSPLGRALLGKRVGDECEVALAGRTRVVLVLSIS